MSKASEANEREAVAGLLLRLRELGVTDHRLLSAFEQVPRQSFVPVIYLDAAYDRGQFPIECGQMMTSVDLVARTLHALDVPPNAKVLELGTGSGYQSALLANLAEKVISIERYRTLEEKSRIRLKSLELDNVRILLADGSNGGDEQGLFDRIVSNCSFDVVPKGFLDRLSSGGVMVAPIGPGDETQILTKLTKVGSRFEIENLFEVRYQPFIPGISEAI
ncbi:MAG: protein-L-isoaspartate(D-aspartate) O-methyltransferase [Rhizobiaceae bacterium]|nr:protein-L-isoaspartate(D-aspartate) O-methyltransferase [Rhizobiaceae bacterium]